MAASRHCIVAAAAALLLISCASTTDVPLVLAGTVSTTTTTTTTTVPRPPATTTTTTTVPVAFPEIRLAELPWIPEPDLRDLHDRAAAVLSKIDRYKLGSILPAYRDIAGEALASVDAHYESIMATLPYDKFAAWPAGEKYRALQPDLDILLADGLYALERGERARAAVSRRAAQGMVGAGGSDTPVRIAESFARAEEASVQATQSAAAGIQDLAVDTWRRAIPLYDFAGQASAIDALRAEILAYEIGAVLAERWNKAEQGRTDAFALWDSGSLAASSPGSMPETLEYAASLLQNLRPEYAGILLDGLVALTAAAERDAITRRDRAAALQADTRIPELFAIGSLLMDSADQAKASATWRLAMDRYRFASRVFEQAETAARRLAAVDLASRAALDEALRRAADAEAAAARSTAATAAAIPAPQPAPQPAPLPAAPSSLPTPPVAREITARDAASALLREATDRQAWALLHNAVNNYPDAIRDGSALIEDARGALSRGDYRAASEGALGALRRMDPIREFAPLPARYVVRPYKYSGDSLRSIAAYPFVYGDLGQWRVLYRANRGILPDPANPDLVHPGQVLQIPPLAGEHREGVWSAKKTYPPLRGTTP